jgi:2-oxoglutarate ferredoxin oxidoreductase subunit alpha
VIVDVQRGGPSTGLPTKTEQADLLQAIYGRNGESPIGDRGAHTPGDCFDVAIEAARIALKYMDPGDGAVRRLPRQRHPSPGGCPTSADLPDISVPFATEANQVDGDGNPVSGPICAIPRRWRDRGRFPAPLGWSTASAGSRRLTAPATSPTTRATTSA